MERLFQNTTPSTVFTWFLHENFMKKYGGEFWVVQAIAYDDLLDYENIMAVWFFFNTGPYGAANFSTDFSQPSEECRLSSSNRSRFKK